MKKKSIRYQGKVVFEKVHMEGTFQRFPKLFQEEEACFLYMGEGTFSFRTPTNLIEIKSGEAIVAKCGNYFIEQFLIESVFFTPFSFLWKAYSLGQRFPFEI